MASSPPSAVPPPPLPPTTSSSTDASETPPPAPPSNPFSLTGSGSSLAKRRAVEHSFVDLETAAAVTPILTHSISRSSSPPTSSHSQTAPPTDASLMQRRLSGTEQLSFQRRPSGSAGGAAAEPLTAPLASVMPPTVSVDTVEDGAGGAHVEEVPATPVSPLAVVATSPVEPRRPEPPPPADEEDGEEEGDEDEVLVPVFDRLKVVESPAFVPPTAKEIVDYARYLGIDPVFESNLLWIAEEALIAPLPEGWDEAVDQYDDRGDRYYVHVASGRTQWAHPYDPYYRELVHLERRRAAARAAGRNPSPNVPQTPSGTSGVPEKAVGPSEVIAMARYLGIELDGDEPEYELLPLALRAAQAPLAPDWQEVVDSNGGALYVNKRTKQTAYGSPTDRMFREMVKLERAKREARKAAELASGAPEAGEEGPGRSGWLLLTDVKGRKYWYDFAAMPGVGLGPKGAETPAPAPAAEAERKGLMAGARRSVESAAERTGVRLTENQLYYVSMAVAAASLAARPFAPVLRYLRGS